MPHELFDYTYWQLKGISGFGKSILGKVEEILGTGKLAKLTNYLEDSHTKAAMELCEIWGVGPVKAEHLIAGGYGTVQSLKDVMANEGPAALDNILTTKQITGLKYHDDLMMRIPRTEV